MSQPLTILEQLGFGKYEAQAYVALLRHSPMNGYELARRSGVPRANIYDVLARLEERGAVLRADNPGGTAYVPVAPTELLDRLGTGYQTLLQDAQDSLAGLTAPAKREEVLNIQGYDALLDQARAVIDGARERLLVAVWHPESHALAQPIEAAAQRGVELTTLCMQNCPHECGDCRGSIFRYAVVPQQQTRWLLLAPDGAELLAGEIGPGDEAHTVRTRQHLLVDLARWYVRHTIALAALINDLNGRVDQLLQPQTRSILKAVGPDQGGGWLAHMRTLLARKGGTA